MSLRPGPFLLFPALPARDFVPWTTEEGEGCGSCRWQSEWGRYDVPCRRCDRFCSEWTEKLAPTGHTLAAGMRVGGRDCVGRAFEGTIERIVGRYTVVLARRGDATLAWTPTGLLEWVEIDGRRETAVFEH